MWLLREGPRASAGGASCCEKGAYIEQSYLHQNDPLAVRPTDPHAALFRSLPGTSLKQVAVIETDTRSCTSTDNECEATELLLHQHDFRWGLTGDRLPEILEWMWYWYFEPRFCDFLGNFQKPYRPSLWRMDYSYLIFWYICWPLFRFLCFGSEQRNCLVLAATEPKQLWKVVY